MRRWISEAVVLGAAAGLFAFGVETGLILHAEGMAGVNIDVQGPVAAVLRAVRPQLPALIGRIALTYAVAGAVFGVAAAALASLVLPSGAPRRARVLAVAAELAGFGFLLCWWHAIQRPALLDDLPGGTAALEWVVNAGRPWHAAAFGAAWLAAHAGVAARVHGRGRALAAVGAMGGVVGLWWLPAIPEASGSSRRSPLVVMVGIDAFRPDRLSAFGGTGAVAPHLEAFVREATLFTRAYTPIAQTEPAWRTLLTARWPHHTGVRHPLTSDDQVDPLPTFAGALREKGYFTSFRTDCSRWHYSLPASGFEERIQPPRGAINFLLEKLRYRGVGMVASNRLGAWWLPELVDNRALAGIHDPRAYAERLAADWSEEAGRGPALLAYHATAAHFPGDPVYPHYRQFVPEGAPLSRRLRMVFEPVSPETRASWSREGSEELYDELLAQADEQLGIILDGLRRSGRYEDALVVVFSDHGEDFYADRPNLEGATSVHGARLSEEENHVLLAVKLPRGEKAPARVDDLVRLIDVGPTLLEHEGAPPLPGADGVSLMPLLRGEARPPLVLYAETGFSHASPEVFDPDHLKGFPRSFEAYQVRDDGVVVMSGPAHEASLREKDIGAFDGEGWLVRSPQRDGSVMEHCQGPHCPALSRWLDETGPEAR
ncbi:MAG TPA: sulfatase-like hydrolase/transferase [Myxococcaceae bacterium]|nr:sulfatase-like hydrolase/transferase [Myxococcaceae bacterium]